MSHSSLSSRRCHRTLVGTTLAVMLMGMSPDRTEAAGTLYWSTTDCLRRASTEGDCRQTIQDCETNAGIGDVDVDLETGKIYFIRSGTIRRCDLDGANTEVVYSGPAAYLDIDRVNRKIYWSETDDDGDENRIMRANLDFSTIEPVVSELPTGSRGIAVDSAGGKVYWVQTPFGNETGSIHRVSLDGTAHEQIAVSGQSPRGIAVHHASAKVFWTDGNSGDASPGGVYRANLDFSNVEQIVSALPGLRGIDVDEAAGMLYFGRQVVPQDIFRCDLNGGGLVALGVGSAFGVAVVSEELGFGCFGDVNGDLAVNVDDLLSVIGSWGPCRSCPADFNGDGIVNIDDLLYVLNYWTF